jgi:hypothetical protein
MTKTSLSLEERLTTAALLLTRIDSILGGLYISYLATRERLKMLLDTNWYDVKLERYDNKLRMKEVGGAYYQYLVFLKTSGILTMAKSIEDTLFLVKHEAGQTIKFWKEADRFEFGASAKEIRALANIMKHNLSIVNSAQSSSGAYLVNQCAYPDNVDVHLLMMEDKNTFDIPATIVRIYCFLLSVVEKVTNVRHPFLDLDSEDRTTAIRNHLIPEVLGFQQTSRG